MTRPDETVRARRYALACALADAVDEEGRPTRTSDALTEFERALEEEGDEPPADRIHLAAGRLLEAVDPARALQNYVEALAGDAAEESAERARALLNASPQPSALIAALPSETIDAVAQSAQSATIAQPGRLVSAFERVTRQTVGRQPGQVTLLAATLLRQRGADEDALDLLQRSYNDAGSRAREIVAQLAETLLDLDRPDETVALVEAEDPDGREPSLQVVGAEAQLIRGNLEEALRLADRLLDAGSAPPAAATVRALSLLGLNRLDEALEAVTDEQVTEGPELDLGRTIVRLQRREYAAAREASWPLLRAAPTDPDALLLNAQTTVEAVGTPRDEDTSAMPASEGVAGATPGTEVDAARRLLSELVAELPEQGLRSRWWRAQNAVRGGDDRFRFFRSALRVAAGTDVDLDQLAAGDDTTWLQKAAFEELRIEVFDRAGEHALAATAHDEASRIFSEDAVDVERAWLHARDAYEQQPSAARAASYARQTLAVSYEIADSTEQSARLSVARAAMEQSLTAAEEDELANLVNLLAWVRARLQDVNGESPPEDDRAVLSWLFVGVAVQPDDAVLRAVLAAKLTGVDQKVAAVVHATDGFDADPNTPYVVEVAVVAGVNYYTRAEDVRPFLDRHAEVSGDDELWRNAVELNLALAEGDRDRVEECQRPEKIDAPWVRLDRATAEALLAGVPNATAELERALTAAVADTPADAAFFAALLGRRDDVIEHIAAAREDPATNEFAVRSAELIEQFTFQREMTEEQFVTPALELCQCPAEVGWVVHVTLPLLIAARSGATGPVAPANVDQDVLDARLRAFGDPRTHYLPELERYWPGLAPLATLADTRTGLASLADAEENANGVWPEDLPEPVRDRVGRMIVSRAAAKIPHRLLESHLGRRADVDNDDVRLVLEGSVDAPLSVRLATALLTRPADISGQTMGAAAEDDVAAAVDEIVQVDVLADYWTLDALVQSARHDPAVPDAVRRVASATSERLGVRLDELLGLTRSESGLEIAVVTPIVVEVGSDLVPLVDSNQDGGEFLERLIPAMRDRILASTGVSVPGVRLRGSESLAPNEYCAQVDEVPVSVGSVDVEATFAVHVPTDRPESTDELSDVHPLTGAPGLWALRRSDEDGEDAIDHLNAAELLIHRIESVIRANLARFLGPQEVDTLVTAWSTDDEELVASVLPDADAEVRLTWVLQALVDDGIPISDWQAILAEIREAGGIGASLVSLQRAVRGRLRDSLPGQTGRTRVEVPVEHEDALLTLVSGEPSGELPAEPRLEFLTWLRARIEEHGVALTLMTRADETREIVDTLARTESRLIATLSESEVASA